MKTRLLTLFISAILMLSCGSEKYDLPENANQLLTNDSSKTWKLSKRYNGGHRMNMGDCFLSYRVTYNSNGKINDNNSENTDCGDYMEANWSFENNEDAAFIKWKGPKIKTLMNIDKDYKFFKVKQLSDTLLILSFRHKQFGGTERKIEDYLVPENLEVKGRNFHH